MVILYTLLFNFAFSSYNFELNGGMFEAIHNRPDLKVERLLIQIACFNQDGTSANLGDCTEVIADGKPNDGFIEFSATSSKIDQIFTKDISIHDSQKSRNFFCIGMKVIFDGFPNRCDE